MKGMLWLLLILLVGYPLAAQENPDPPPTDEPAETVKPSPKPTKPDAYKEYKAGHYDRAVAICLNEIKATPGNRDSYVVLGWALVAQGKYKEAFDYARLGIEKTGQDRRLIATAEEALTKLYAWYYSRGQYDDAVPVIQRFIAFLPNSDKIPSAYAVLGEIYLKKGKYIRADIALTYALRTNPQAFEWWLGAGLAREKFGDFKSSLAAYTEALKLDPTHQEALRGRDRVREKLSLSPAASSPSP